MPLAVPLTREHYVQYLRTEPDAPRREPARTTEVKGKRRVGDGQAFRLFGPHAVVLGRWSPTTTEERIEHARTVYRAGLTTEERDDGWGRLIRPDEIDTVAGQIMSEKISEGWNPPPWHWRFYWEWVLDRLNNVGLVNVLAYNSVRFTPRRFVRGLSEALKARWVAHEEPEPQPEHWVDFGDDGFEI